MKKSGMPRNQNSDQKWIHSFAVTDVCLHPKKFTVYKITSVVFPIEIPEALTCLTVWKRFNDVKALLKYVNKRWKSDKLPGTVPTLNNHVYFKRFEADVITERKFFIIRLLDYVAQHAILYKSQVLHDFFTKGQTVPNEECLQFFADDSLTATVDSADLVENNTTISTEIAHDTELSTTSSSIDDESIESSNVSPISMASSSFGSAAKDDRCVMSSDGDDVDATVDDIDQSDLNDIDQSTTYGQFDSARLERNISYDHLYQIPSEARCLHNQRIDLSQFKVLKVFDNVMQVQDVCTKHVYIMKSIDKISNEAEDFYLPTNFPFMVSLVSYYVSDTNIFLLLEQATGGKLYDYIRSYDRKSSRSQNSIAKFLSTNFDTVLASKSLYKSSTIKIPEPISTTPNTNDENILSDDINDSFYSLLQSYYYDVPDNSTGPNVNDAPNHCEDAPHFDLIANDLDVNNIISCSQKLLRSVSHTLERIHREPIERRFSYSDIAINYNDSVEVLDVTAESESGSDDIQLNPSHLPCENDADCRFAHAESETIIARQLPKAILKRWFREIIFAVKHLHANEIFCYDLQPHNLLLGNNGEILLTYFYRREFYSYFSVDTMNPTCYSLAYIAPERPLTSLSDVWSIGVIFYELITGHSFQSCHPDIYTYFEVQYPESFEPDTDTRDLLEGLLQLDPEQRLKLDEIEGHPFFKSS